MEKQIILIHGAWHGGWVWDRLGPLLKKAGYNVICPDLSGLGANSHRQSPNIGLHVHGHDILNLLFYNDLRDSIIVGHSYGGCVVSEVLAGDSEKRIVHAVYLDAFVPENKEGLISFIPPNLKAEYERLAVENKMIPPRPPEEWEKLWGLTGKNAEFAAERLGPVSARCFTETVQGDPFKRGVTLNYLRCKQNPNPVFENTAAKVREDKRFGYAEIESHHDVMMKDPDLLFEALTEIFDP